MTEQRTPPVDWERVEAQYAVGTMSLREIAADHGNQITEGAIRKRAKKYGWHRDLTVRVRAKADALVRMTAVRSTSIADQTPTETQIVEVEAQVQARIRLAHRVDITRMRALAIRLLGECEAETADPDLFAELGEMLRAPDDRGTDKLNDAYHKAISLPQRIKGVKDLADTLKTLVAMEREAFGIDLAPEAPPEAQELTADRITEGARRLAFALYRAASLTPTGA